MRFWQQFGNAVMVGDGKILQLVGETSFLGDPSLGDKMMIRECYNRLWSKVEDDFRIGARGRVVIGTPGEKWAESSQETQV
jgi:hypothetical protein